MHSTAEPLSASNGEPPLALLAGEILGAWDAWTDELNGEPLASLVLASSAAALTVVAPSSSSSCTLKTRIGPFALYEATRTEPFPYATLSSHRACGCVWPELTKGFLETSRENSVGNSLYNYRSRYYDAGVGRFTSVDPAGFPDGPNQYVYVANNPTNQIDPTGTAIFTPPPDRYPNPWGWVAAYTKAKPCTPSSELVDLSIFRAYNLKRIAEEGADQPEPYVISGDCSKNGAKGWGLWDINFQHRYFDSGGCCQFCAYAHELIHQHRCQSSPWLGWKFSSQSEIEGEALTFSFECANALIALGANPAPPLRGLSFVWNK